MYYHEPLSINHTSQYHASAHYARKSNILIICCIKINYI